MADRPRKPRRDDEDEPRRSRAPRKGRPPQRGGRSRPDGDEPQHPRAPRKGRPSKRGETQAPRHKQDRYKKRGETQGSSRGRRDDDKKKRTSRQSDERNPTRSGIQYPRPKYKQKEEEAPKQRPSLRKVQSEKPPAKAKRTRPVKKKDAPRRRRGSGTEAGQELAKVAGRNATKIQAQLARAAEAYNAGRERDAQRILRPLKDTYPNAASIRELMGLTHYRLGQYRAAAKELQAFVDLTNSVEQHPVLMDSLRAQREYGKVEELWEELASSSPSGGLVTEGRIVYAGSLADQGQLQKAIDVLSKRADEVKRVQPHHLRLWYALADLHERAGDVVRARELFERVQKRERGFADVAERLVVLR